ncbi:single-stranded DNA-binding protein [Lapidilactobacillus wuchangensis]|uniref:single-stranded DNA-binding protein n=1 Tax=Lapidilactobacillus wuchangensis TaxID=2486001 RepID=UPI000F77EF4B|nr:single-stranded DNA-binding protein [Lapidilactobacillus wuchangensis]
MINRVVLIGRLTRDVELRYTGSGTAVATFTLAVNRQFTNAQGEREADFISCVLWRKAAENFANFTHKGSLVGVEGRVQTRNYENNQGNRVYVTEVVVDNFSLLEPKSSQDGSHTNMGGNANNGGGYQSNNNTNNNNNFNNQNPTGPTNGTANNQNQGNNGGNNNATNDPFADSSEPIDISDDDLPF